ncbi:transcriptional regulator, partial [Streptomyces sp. SID11233]|nr:transcriptional regulator [Streptomyces sp. SID11233]
MAQSSSSSVQQARQVLADRLREIVRDAGLDGKGLAAL